MGAEPSKFNVATAGDDLSPSLELPYSSYSNTGNTKTDPILVQDDDMIENQRKSLERVFGTSLEESHSPQTRQAVKFGFITLVSATVLVFIIFLILFATGASNNNDEDSHDEQESGKSRAKLTFGILWMLLAAAGLSVVACLHFWNGIATTMPSRYRVGMLGGSLLGYAGMVLVSALYFWPIGSEEQESQDRYLEQNDDDDDDDNEDDSQTNLFTAFCITCLILSLLYSILACIVFWKHPLILAETTRGPDTTRTMSPDETTMTRSAAKADVLSDVWDAVCVMAIMSLLLSVIFVPISFAMQDEREREESGGQLWNFLLVDVCMIVFVCVLGKVGRNVLGRRKMTSRVAIGGMNGGLFFFSATAFMVAVFYTFMSFGGEEERRREDENQIGSGGFAVVCYFLAAAYGCFAIGVAKHHKSLIRAKAKDIYSVEQWRQPFVCGEAV